MRYFDYPPIWLALFLALSWAIAELLPDWTMHLMVGSVAGLGMVGIGLALMLAAVWQMLRAGTTVVPHREPQKIMTNGVFRISRNPIYLGDVFVLSGVIVWAGAVLAVPLIGVFIRIIERRFIIPEEMRLKAGHSEDFDAWSTKVRRWL